MLRFCISFLEIVWENCTGLRRSAEQLSFDHYSRSRSAVRSSRSAGAARNIHAAPNSATRFLYRKRSRRRYLNHPYKIDKVDSNNILGAQRKQVSHFKRAAPGETEFATVPRDQVQHFKPLTNSCPFRVARKTCPVVL